MILLKVEALLLASLCLTVLPALTAKNLKIVTIESPPFIIRDDDNPNNVKGYLVDLLQKLRNKLRFNYRIHFVRDGKFGEELVRGHWNGIIGEVQSGRADIGLAPLAITRAREEVVDFTVPFMSTGIRMLTKKPKAGTALPVTTFKELAASDRNFGTLQSGSSYAFFKKSKYGLYRGIGKVMERRMSDLPAQVDEAVEKVKDDDFVFLGESAMMKYWTGHDCDIMMIGSDINTVGYGIAFANGSSQVREFSNRLLELQEKGILQQLKRKWWTSRCRKASLCVCPADVSSEEDPASEEQRKEVGGVTVPAAQRSENEGEGDVSEQGVGVDENELGEYEHYPYGELDLEEKGSSNQRTASVGLVILITLSLFIQQFQAQMEQ